MRAPVRLREAPCEALAHAPWPLLSKASVSLQVSATTFSTKHNAPKVKLAKLDVAFIDSEGRRCYVDVAVTSAATSSAQNRAKRADNDSPSVTW